MAGFMLVVDLNVILLNFPLLLLVNVFFKTADKLLHCEISIFVVCLVVFNGN